MKKLEVILAATPGLAGLAAGLLVPAWAAIVPGAAAGAAIALCASGASAIGAHASGLGSIGWRLAAVGLRIAGTATAMVVIGTHTPEQRAATVAMLASVAFGWLVEMTAWTLRLVQERKPARA